MVGAAVSGTPMHRLGAVTLHSAHTVYDAGRRCLVESTRRRDGSITGMQPISPAAVETAARLPAAGRDTIEELARGVERLGPTRHGVAYGYGRHLRSQVERALLMLVARGGAAAEQQGRASLLSGAVAAR